MVKRIFKISGLCLVVLVLILLGTKGAADARYFDEYDPTLPFNVRMDTPEAVDSTVSVFGIERPQVFTRHRIVFESRPGEMVPTLMAFPKTFKGRLPVIVFLHGIGQSKGFLNTICSPFTQGGFAMACFDQHMQGERDVKGSLLDQAVAFRQRPWKTVNDTRRFIDYLETRNDIDPERIYLVGASYGAITGSTVVAREKRIRAAVMVVGGANIPVLLDAPLIREAVPGWVHALAKPLVNFIMKPADPIRYAHETSPTPVLFQNGDRDTLVTPAAGRELHRAAGEPKEIRWYPCDHPGLDENDGRVIVRILDEALAWLTEQDAPFRDPVVEDTTTAIRDAA